MTCIPPSDFHSFSLGIPNSTSVYLRAVTPRRRARRDVAGAGTGARRCRSVEHERGRPAAGRRLAPGDPVRRPGRVGGEGAASVPVRVRARGSSGRWPTCCSRSWSCCPTAPTTPVSSSCCSSRALRGSRTHRLALSRPGAAGRCRRRGRPDCPRCWWSCSRRRSSPPWRSSPDATAHPFAPDRTLAEVATDAGLARDVGERAGLRRHHDGRGTSTRLSSRSRATQPYPVLRERRARSRGQRGTCTPDRLVCEAAAVAARRDARRWRSSSTRRSATPDGVSLLASVQGVRLYRVAARMTGAHRTTCTMRDGHPAQLHRRVASRSSIGARAARSLSSTSVATVGVTTRRRLGARLRHQPDRGAASRRPRGRSTTASRLASRTAST